MIITSTLGPSSSPSSSHGSNIPSFFLSFCPNLHSPSKSIRNPSVLTSFPAWPNLVVNHALLVLRLREPAGSQLSPSILGACFWPLNALREIHKALIDIITNLWSPVIASPPHCPQYLNVFRPHQLEQIWPKFTTISRPTLPNHRPYSQKIILLPLRG